MRPALFEHGIDTLQVDTPRHAHLVLQHVDHAQHPVFECRRVTCMRERGPEHAGQVGALRSLGHRRAVIAVGNRTAVKSRSHMPVSGFFELKARAEPECPAVQAAARGPAVTGDVHAGELNYFVRINLPRAVPRRRERSPLLAAPIALRGGR